MLCCVFEVLPPWVLPWGVESGQRVLPVGCDAHQAAVDSLGDAEQQNWVSIRCCGGERAQVLAIRVQRSAVKAARTVCMRTRGGTVGSNQPFLLVCFYVVRYRFGLALPRHHSSVLDKLDALEWVTVMCITFVMAAGGLFQAGMVWGRCPVAP